MTRDEAIAILTEPTVSDVDAVREAVDVAVKVLKEPEWDDLLVICDNCGHTIHVAKKDARHIIRCRDCKWFNDSGCAICIVDDSDRPKENDFCSFAERKSDERHDIPR